jgi:hypothetical protein
MHGKTGSLGAEANLSDEASGLARCLRTKLRRFENLNIAVASFGEKVGHCAADCASADNGY